MVACEALATTAMASTAVLEAAVGMVVAAAAGRGVDEMAVAQVEARALLE